MNLHMKITCSLALAAMLMIGACKKDDTTPEFTAPDSSYGLVYSKIFESSCATSNCHGGAAEPNLASADTYNDLFAAPINQEAAQAGLQLVVASDVDNSFLYQKLIFADSPFQFGSPMPLGGLTITENQIEFIRQWIAAGAPETGHVADRSLIE